MNAATYLYATDSVVNTGALAGNQDAYWNGDPSDAGVTLAAGTPLGLLRVEYSVPVNTTGVFPLTVVDGTQDPSNGSIWGDSGFNVNIPLLVSGTLTVLPAEALPEPSSVLLLAIGLAGLAVMRLRRARRSA